MSRSTRGLALAGCQFTGILLAVSPFAPPRGPAVPGLLLVAAAILLACWSLWHNPPGNFRILPELHPRGRLVTTGPYRTIRHPMYTAVILGVAGAALYHGRWVNLLGAATAVVAVVLKAKREEELLGRRHQGYRSYRLRTGRFLPWFL